MQALIDFIIRNLLALWPITRVSTWHQGLRLRGGIAEEELGPGLHWRWWFIDEVKQWPSNIMAADLPTAAITTTDGYPVAVSANIVYRMTSIRLMHIAIWSPDVTILKVAAGEIASLCAIESWEGLRTNRPRLESRLTASLNERVAPWGLCVDRVHLTDLVLLAKPHRHYVEGMKAS
jgi:regulator of protease activity HflC (stomatin/prohibitin superfamily)